MATTEATPSAFTYDIVLPEDSEWIPVQYEGNFLKPIMLTDDGEWAMLAKLAKGTVEPRHRHIGSFSNYLISGAIEIYGKRIGPGAWMIERDGAIHDGVTALEDSVAYLHGRGGAGELLGPNDEVLATVDYVAWVKTLAEMAGLTLAK